MDALIRPLPFDAAALRGLSARLLSSHHQNNYGGAVRRLNAIRAQLAGTAFATAPGYLLNGLKREELLATNSMLLHELYFASLGGDGHTMAPAMTLALDASFGSVERWREEFVACARALGGGSGWMLLVFQPHDGTLVNQWAADHTNALAGGVPILALDLYEHAYHLDYGAAASPYVDACMANLDWAGAYARYQAAVQAASDGCGAEQDDVASALLLDVRRAGVFEGATSMIPGARWREEFVACARALGGGSGWMLLVFQPRDGTLVNQWAADHTNALAGGVPILALDLYEHAYHLDYGAAASAYVDACMANLDWAGAYARYQAAVQAASDGCGAAQDDVTNSLLLDVRRAGVFEGATSMIPGARWRDPAAIGQWAAELPRNRDVVVYCVYGHEVSRATALRLRAAGINARYLRGGLDGWQSSGRPVAAKAGAR